MIFVAILFSICASYLVHYLISILRHRGHGCIPGPFPLPVIGNLHLIGKYFHKEATALSKQYGEVFAIYVGSERRIMASSAKAMKEIMIEKGTHFAGRSQDNIKLYYATMQFKDIVAADYGPQLKYLRKLFTRGLNLHGFNKLLVTQTIQKHAEALVTLLEDKSGETVDVREYLHFSTMNVILNMVFGTEKKFGDPLFVQMLKSTTLIFAGIRPGPEDVFTWLRYFPNERIRQVKEGAAIRDKITSKIIQEHRDTYSPGVIRDMTDAFLAAEAEELAAGGERLDHGSFTMLVNEAFVAGIETTSSTLLWMLLYLAKNPEKQTKLRKELLSVDLENLDGFNPSILPYTHAAVFETQRLASVLPFAGHKTTQDTTLCGFPIAKDTPIIVNLYGIMHDESNFDKPHEYIPERWLDEKGDYCPSNTLNLPFGAGPRACPGRQLANLVLYGFITRLLKNVLFQEVPGQENDLEVELGLSLCPKDVKMKIGKV